MRENLEKELESPEILAKDIDKELFINYKKIYNRVLKRILDLILALVLMGILLPIFLIVGILIIIETGFPVFYRADRGGYKGKKFKIYKFRSMIKNADKIGGGTTALNDIRITKVGSFLRKTKLDEIPNLINIIKGEMSFIGPRPELLKYIDQYEGTEKLILEVRPGITDFSSIEFINLDEIVGTENVDQRYEELVLPKKNKLRLKYVSKISFLTDVKIFFSTIEKVVKKAIKYIVRSDK
ncbi:sugar transferase [Fusobacterium perfoetens]|uniref:sugar transferase n=1 Tax=Fusobacterium perfoetens TaxID=852 RepID=UPI0026E94038|nr:sugar transferase [Fusobacterium perfoetens]